MKNILKDAFSILGVFALIAFTIHVQNSFSTAASGVSMALILSAGNLSGIFQTWKTVFNKAFAEAQTTYPQIATIVPSTAAVELHAWLGAFPKMREWIGERNIKNLKTYKWQIENKDWESTVVVPRNSIQDDQYGLFTNVIASMGASAKTHPEEIVYGLLNAGFTALGYDGKAFFATDHVFGSNKGTAALAAPSYGLALAAIKRIKDDSGKFLFTGNEQLTLVVPPELESTARKILESDFVSVAGGSAENNIYKGSAKLIVSPQLTSATAWFIIVDFNGLKPLIFQERQKPQFTTAINPDDPNVFMRKEFLYGADSRDNAGYGLPQLAYGSTGAA